MSKNYDIAGCRDIWADTNSDFRVCVKDSIPLRKIKKYLLMLIYSDLVKGLNDFSNSLKSDVI